MNKTPEKWVSDIGPYYMGHASNWPINGRLSQGPSLYGWDGNTPPTTREILYYSLNNPLGSHDAENPANPLWNELSHAAVGFIHGDDYIVLGLTEGLKSGIGYKVRGSGG